MLTFEQIKELTELVARRQLQGLELERSGFRLKIDGQGSAPAAAPAPAPAPPPAAAGSAPPPPAAEETPAPADGPAIPDDAHMVKSPMVGTFYRSSTPDSDPFTEVGATVRKGQTLCIVEAMKTFNGIDSEVDGEILAIFPQNGQPVEFGELLFAVKVR